MSLKYGSHWYMQKKRFNEKFRYDEFVRKIKSDTGTDARPGSLIDRKRDDIFKHYYDHYNEPVLPPSWMVAEILSLSSWSLIFENLVLKEDKRDIANNLIYILGCYNPGYIA